MVLQSNIYHKPDNFACYTELLGSDHSLDSSKPLRTGSPTLEQKIQKAYESNELIEIIFIYLFKLIKWFAAEEFAISAGATYTTIKYISACWNMTQILSAHKKF